MKLNYTDEQNSKIIRKLMNENSGRFWEKNGHERFYLSSEISCEVSSVLACGTAVSPYIDLISHELICMNEESEKICWNIVKSILKNER